jgi:hypothetical protein
VSGIQTGDFSGSHNGFLPKWASWSWAATVEHFPNIKRVRPDGFRQQPTNDPRKPLFIRKSGRFFRDFDRNTHKL